MCLGCGLFLEYLGFDFLGSETFFEALVFLFSLLVVIITTFPLFKYILLIYYRSFSYRLPYQFHYIFLYINTFSCFTTLTTSLENIFIILKIPDES